MIRLENVRFSYHDQGPSVQDVSFHVEKGEFVAILGANGAGKTTTVRLIDGLIRPESGRVLINGTDTAVSSVSERARQVGFLFQNPDRQICRNTVREEILFGLRTVRGEEGEDALQARTDEILKDFDAVVLACGSSNPRDIKAEGRDAQGIYFAVDFLRATTKSLLDSDMTDGKFISAKDKNVVIIGGGDTGNDCVGTSVRHGCKSVAQLEMMPKLPDERAENNPWPEWPKVCKTDYGQEEAIAVFGHDPRIYTTTVKEFIKDEKGALSAIKTIKLDFVTDEASGRRIPKEIDGSEEIIPCEICLIAAGFLGCQSYVAETFGVELDGRTNVKTAVNSHATNVPKVFTAGDMHIGQSLVVRAIREGRDAAAEVDKYLMGYTNI